MLHRLSGLLGTAAVVALFSACAADLPADERMAMIEDSLEQARRLDPAQVERDQLAACLDAYNTQFDVEALIDSTGKGEQIPAELAEAVVERDYPPGEDPNFARAQGWPVAMPAPLPGSILPCRRIVAYYGNPLSTRMGVLGEYPKDEMLRRFQAARWPNGTRPTRATRFSPRCT